MIGRAIGVSVVVLSALCFGCTQDKGAASQKDRPIPVETAAVEQGAIRDARTFTGTLDGFTELAIASRIAGRVKQVAIDLGDAAPSGQLLITLEDEELRQAVSLAQADVAVANAQLIEVQSTAETTQRELTRVEQLQTKGLLSEAALDAARAAERTAAAALERARGGVLRAKSQLATARIQLDYTRIEAGALQGGGTRVVSARHVDPGDAVTANQALVTLVEIDPLIAAIAVTEQDYMRIALGQRATLTTDGVVGRSFEAKVARIAPKFAESSRQARIELHVDNAQQLLKPGLFVRATLVLGEVEQATIVPEAALTRRNERDGVFVVDASGTHVSFRPVEVGIREGGRVQVTGEGVTGQVVTLGQQLLDEGSTIAPQAVAPKPTSERGNTRAEASDG